MIIHEPRCGHKEEHDAWYSAISRGWRRQLNLFTNLASAILSISMSRSRAHLSLHYGPIISRKSCRIRVRKPTAVFIWDRILSADANVMQQRHQLLIVVQVIHLCSDWPQWADAIEAGVNRWNRLRGATAFQIKFRPNVNSRMQMTCDFGMGWLPSKRVIRLSESESHSLASFHFVSLINRLPCSR